MEIARRIFKEDPACRVRLSSPGFAAPPWTFDANRAEGSQQLIDLYIDYS
ncbi:MAG: hypothetical protein SPL30_06510 [Succinivibrio sp.]|nr:hypothetical protein [Succinivibrio sp.]